jgi:hypothetical protein
MTLGMSDTAKLSREERLAAKLRENLRRRKAQSRAIDGPKAALSKEEPEG